jgi:hypothetical protein
MGENYFLSQILPVIVICGLYILIIVGLIVLLRKLRIPRKRAVLLACLIFGIGMGLLTACLWPNDISVIVNFPAAFLGDWIYQQSIQYLGDPHSPQAHYTIPWLLRVPQVYVPASVMFWGAAGALVQLAYNKLKHQSNVV